MPHDAAACALAWIGYAVWLCAGFVDFRCHRHTDLPHTSGLRESALHLVQLALIGAGIVLCLALAPSRGVVALAAALVAGHALFGYLDTVAAYGRRDILPFEQHVHSVLDTAPLVALVGYVFAHWTHFATQGWALQLRDPPLSALTWSGVLLPALALCVGPALLEYRSAWRAARG